MNTLKEIESEKPDHQKLIEELYVENLQVIQFFTKITGSVAETWLYSGTPEQSSEVCRDGRTNTRPLRRLVSYLRDQT